MAQLLCLHGFTGCPLSFQALVPTVPAERVLAPVLSGHGSPPAGPAPSFVGEVRRLGRWLAARSTEPVQLVGYSLGARLGLGLLLEEPTRFSSAILVGVNPGLCSDAERQARRVADAHWIDKLLGQGLEAFIDHWEQLPLFRTQAALPLERIEAQRRCRQSHTARGLAHALAVLGLAEMPDYWSALGRIDQPVTLVVGERDEKFRRIAEAMSSALPRARLELASGAGHNVLLERPALFQRLVQEGA